MTRVLIVDDKDDNLYYLRALLEATGYEVDSARHGAEALIKARQVSPGIVVSDLLMPVMDGFTLLHHWKADEALRHIPFVVYTATYTHPEDEQLAVSLGADAFILKPAEPDDVLRRIREVETRGATRLPTLGGPLVVDDPVLLKQYNETLIWKLEEKTLQLTETNRALQLDVAERKRAEEAAATSEAEFRSLAEAMPQIVWITAPDGKNIYFNHQWMEYTGLTREESVGDGWNTPFHPDDRQRAWDAWQHAIRTVGTYSVESRLRRADGVYRWWLVRGVPLVDESGKIVKWFGTCTDIHDLKVADLEIARVNRALTMLSRTNEAVLRENQEAALLNAVCRIAVEDGGYRMAWIGFAPDDEGRSVTPVTHAGAEDGCFSDVTVSNDALLEFASASRVIRTGKAVMFDDLSSHTEFSPWLEVARAHGYRGSICLPLSDGPRTFGVLGLLSQDVLETGAQELTLLQDMADNLAFGIRHKRAEVERGRLDGRVREQAALLDIVREAIMVKDLNGRIVYWNKGAERTYGWTTEEALGHIADELLVTETTASHLGREAVLRQDEWNGEHVRHTKDGRRIFVEAGWTLVRDEHGQPRSILAVNADVTERKRAVEASLAAEERTRFALRNAGIGIWDMDYATGVLRISEIMESQLGLMPGSFGGTLDSLMLCVHPLDRAALGATMTDAGRSGEEFATEFRGQRPDGTIVWLHSKGRVRLGEQGQPLRGVGISMDVTGRHRLEEQYFQAQKMEAVGRLAGGVAHDFNNLLSAILGYCELLLEKVDQGDPRAADILEIQKAGTRAAGLTRQLLAFSRKQIVEPTRLNLNAIVADIRAMLRRLIGEDVEIALALTSNPTLMQADRGQIEQVVMNLALNARDAMPNGGTLTIETTTVELDEDSASTHLHVKPGQYVALTISDTGTGMTAEVQARLFEPFFTTKEAGKGTGLGLATVYGIVTQSGGSIGVYSELGKGSAFKVYFPSIGAAPAIVERPVPAAAPRTGSQLVLVVEDEEGLRELARRLLNRLGHTVLIAANAVEARQIFDEHPAIDLILTDVVMPGASGPELTRQLLEQRPAVKVIFMSGYPGDAIAHHGVLKSGIAFLNKPLTLQSLGDKVRDVLEN